MKPRVNLVAFVIAVATGCGARLLIQVALADRLWESSLSDRRIQRPDPDPHGRPRSTSQEFSEAGKRDPLEVHGAPRALPDARPTAKNDLSDPSPSSENSGVPDELRDAPQDLVETYRRHKAGERLLKGYGSLPVRPLGIPIADYDAWRDSHRPEETLSESAGKISVRLNTFNRDHPIGLETDRFQVFALQPEDRIQSVVGSYFTAGYPLETEHLARALGSLSGRRWQELSLDLQRSMTGIAERVHIDYELARRELWTLVYPAITRKSQLSQYERTLGTAYYDESGLGIVPRGADSEIDRLLFEAADLERSIRQRVQRILTQ